MKLNGARIVLEMLKREGVELVFGYPGGKVLSLYDEIYKMNFPHILTRHEQGAIHAADGYARATGKVGVVFSTSGPGATNLVTGMATAMMDSVPIVCITGQVETPLLHKDSFQEVNIAAIASTVTKYSYTLSDISKLVEEIKKSFAIARQGKPGPVLLDIPRNIFDEEIEFDIPKSIELRESKHSDSCDFLAIQSIIEAIKEAKQPLIFVGGGVNISDTAKEIRSIMDLVGVPAVSTLMGLGVVSSGADAFLGMVGMHGSYGANMAIQECDLLLAVGTRFSDRVTGDVKKFAPKAKIVHFNVDAREMGKNVRADIPIVGDLASTLPKLKVALEDMEEDLCSRFALWRETCIKRANDYPFSYKDSDSAIKPEKLIEKIRQLMPPDTVAVTDVGQHQMWAAQFFKIYEPRQFITSGGQGTMGFGLPAAMGAKLGRNDTSVVLFTGDGGLMMNCQELATIADNNIDVKIIVINNHILGMVAQWQRLFYDNHYSHSELKGKTDFVKMAESMGIKGYRLTKVDELDSILPQLLGKKGPILIDVLVPEDEDVMPMVPGGKSLDKMIME